jgi:glycogen synthase
MRILIYSPAFHPSVGGLEMVMSILAHEFASAGHAVKVVSLTQDRENNLFPFEVVRFPSQRNLLRLVHWCEVFFMGNISLKGLWPLALLRRTVVVTHQGWYCRLNDETGWQDRLKFLVSRFVTNISSSYSVAGHLPGKSVVIHNPYRDDLFHQVEGVTRDRDIVFLGRLVSHKGADILINALRTLSDKMLAPSVTIVGEGPEEIPLREQCFANGLSGQIDFVGRKSGAELVELLNHHKIMIVPSRVREGLPLVVLEGIASGCYVIGSDVGGVREAIGPCGKTYESHNFIDLAGKIEDTLTNERWKAIDAELRERHLSSHRMKATAQRYLNVIEMAHRGTTAML